MILQQILIAEQENSELYYRAAGPVARRGDRMLLGRDAVFATDTYFNAFSIGKWHTFCVLEELRLVMEVRGRLRIKVFHAYEEDGALRQECIWEREADAAGRREVSIALPRFESGVIFFTAQALEEGVELYRARYLCADSYHREITIALNICTFRREAYLLRNLALLRRTFLENEDSPLYGHLKVFVTDNGGTLTADAIADGNVHVCHNPNVGGAGGFARGLLEIARRAREERITRIIFMDDDVEILPESLLRTYRMLRLLREEYRDAFIAGALLRMDRPCIQHENGAIWNAGSCVFVNRGMDMRRFENVVRNESARRPDYAAWWYCCMPIEVARGDNLPIPVFIHGDDVEYSLRNAARIITMNGIAIRHPVAENKRLSANEYYNLRNMLIINAGYAPEYSARQLRKKMFTNLLTALLRYRYKDMHLVYRALRDFCKGPDWLLGLDAAAYHKAIRESGYWLEDMRDRVSRCIQGKENNGYTELSSIREVLAKVKEERGIGKLLCKLVTLNGWLLPAKKGTYTFGMGVHPIDLYRTGAVILYDEASGQGIEVQRSFRQIFVFISLYLKSLILISHKYKQSKEAYRERFGELQRVEYWSRVLK
ncbi:MAG: glycosyltransferase [Roseburia sp.]|nr:glycosyltransferase [Roseburia sp.]